MSPAESQDSLICQAYRLWRTSCVVAMSEIRPIERAGVATMMSGTRALGRGQGAVMSRVEMVGDGRKVISGRTISVASRRMGPDG